MVKVLIYSSKEIYDTSSYEGRAEADIVAYALDDMFYEVVKVRNLNAWVHSTGKFMKRYVKRWVEEESKRECLSS
jgi:hypothetical protein